MSDPNSNRSGYKETKVGWIPDSWSVEPLHQVASVQTGLAKGKSVSDLAIQLPYLRVANVQDGHVVLEDVKEILVDQSEVERYRLRAGDVLFTEGGDFDKLGRGCVWQGQIDPCLHQNHIFAVRCSADRLLPFLLACHASAGHGRKYFSLNSKQSTNLASINSTQLKAFPVPLPPLGEQRRIAELLSTCDKAIEATGDLVKAKQRQKKALIQQLLTGKKHLPGFEGEWKTIRLGEVFHERRETTGDDLPLLAITGKRGIIPASDINRKDSSNADKSRYKIIRVGDLGYNTMRMWQGVNAISSLEGIVSPAYTIATPDSSLYGPFLVQYFKFQPVVYQFYRYSQGLVSDTWNLKFHHFAEIQLPFPEIEEQRAIAAILQTADSEISTLEMKVASLQQEKKALMQKLLTGQVRVKV